MHKKSIYERSSIGRLQAFEILIGLIIMVFIAWLSVNNTELAPVVNSLSFLTIIIIGIWAIDLVKEKNDYVESIGFGKWKDAKIAFIMAILFVIGFLFVGGFFNFQLIVPFAVTSIAWIAIPVAFIEEMFFRSTFTPTISRLLSNFKELSGVYDYLGGAIGCVLFGVFHFLAYGASVNLMFTAIFFGAFMLIGNTYFKSTVFGYTAHSLYNTVIVLALIGVF